MRFIPEEITTFYFEDADYSDKGEISLRYSLDRKYTFEEKFKFENFTPPKTESRKAAFVKALTYLHIMAGVSYYKAALPKNIQMPYSLSKDSAEKFEELYTKGLGEFAYVNKLDMRGRIKFPYDLNSTEAPSDLLLERRTLVPVGGGKDSVVTAEILKGAKEPLSLFVMGSNKSILRVAEIPGLPVVNVKRAISPLLLELNQNGAYNGHVPISAILSFLLVASAIIYDFDSIVMSYEHSASSPTLSLNGEAINHQYSKSLACEKLIRDFIKNKIVRNLEYFSLIRPLSELKITYLFSRFSKYHADFTSCNGHFRLSGSNARWCNNCPKCRFVFLALAPFLNKHSMVSIFGSNILADSSQLEGFQELCGIKGHKPFECVGEIEESRYALKKLSESPEWKDDYIVKNLSKDMPALEGGEFLTEFHAEHLLPNHFLEILNAHLRA